MRRVTLLFASLSGIVGWGAGCAQGGGQAEDDAAPAAAHDATTVADVGDTSVGDAPIGDATDTRPSDVTTAHEGSIFDALDDACAEGATVSCTTSCGTPGDATCSGGSFGRCAPRPGDSCKGLDCTGIGDGREHTYFADKDGDGHGDAKATTEACARPSGAVDNADDCDDGRTDVHPGAAEVCDKVDQNCDGVVDEGVHVLVVDVPFSAAPPCALGDHASCKEGAAAWCRAKSSCYDGGFGPVELAPSDGYFVCVSGGTLAGSLGEASAAQPACSSDSQAGLRVCESAVHRAGGAEGYVSAILQSHAGGAWRWLGLPKERSKAYGGIPFGELTALHAGCHSGTEDSWDCNAATHRWCNAKGHPSGFGPVEYNPTEVAVVCVLP